MTSPGPSVQERPTNSVNTETAWLTSIEARQYKELIVDLDTKEKSAWHSI